MHWTVRRLIASWILGTVAGTAIIATTSPLFVRSYLPLTADAMRGVWTLPPGHTYRWRSEGYSNTRVGPHGMPGKTELAKLGTAARVALWGDSQAEGVCVEDEEKIFAQAERVSRGRLQVLPLARSGEDAADWVTQMPRVDRALDIDAHVLLAVDLEDLLAATSAPTPPPAPSDVAAARAAIAARLPAFVIQAARALLTQEDETTPRRLRFAVGPAATPAATNPRAVSPRAISHRADDARWAAALMQIRSATDQPIVILYAPKLPQIIAGQVLRSDPNASEFERMRAAAQQHDVAVVDLRGPLLQSPQWPHGFHHGRIGSGHLNATGNALVAMALARGVATLIEQGDLIEQGN